ncbi:MAG: protein-(glutamine-N5) methyltransferase, release factor-specific [Gammaproteobacteria bacterium RIFCSPHIGHO2_12_FULL_41_15]|nr:MAG: protein-(glutamine-N5) methyltransferase, release factor-specific [Gammaproteobacteria bacterium RIFCSPHIGHO2_12_FULL_41_15]
MVSDTPRLEVEIFLQEILAFSRAQLIAFSERELTRMQQRQLMTWIEKRLQNEPVAYIVGHQPFWTLDLIVTPDTLIPRPETEHLVDWICETLPSQLRLRIADLGVGSGAIALALASERSLWHIDATDKSAAALEIAAKNAQRYGFKNVNFFCGDWCSALPEKNYDLIVSNPPYIAEKDPHLAKLTFEPQNALVAHDDGMSALRSIISQAKHYLAKEAYLVLEHGAVQQAMTQQFLREEGYSDICLHSDFSGLPRFVVARWSDNES